MGSIPLRSLLLPLVLLLPSYTGSLARKTLQATAPETLVRQIAALDLPVTRAQVDRRVPAGYVQVSGDAPTRAYVSLPPITSVDGAIVDRIELRGGGSTPDGLVVWLSLDLTTPECIDAERFDGIGCSGPIVFPPVPGQVSDTCYERTHAQAQTLMRCHRCI